MLTPVDRFGGSRGRLATFAAAVVVASVSGGVVGSAASSFAAGLATFIAVWTALGFALAFWAAARFREDTAALLNPPRPRVRFGEPRVDGEAGAAAVVVPVVNDPLGARAEELHGTVKVESLDGAVLVDDLPAAWQGTEQRAVTLAANGLPRNIVLDERFRVDADDFLAWVTLIGANVRKLTTVVRVRRTASGLEVVPLAAGASG
jgi:hypothetical protein